MAAPARVAFFDIGDTLGAVRVTPGGTGIEEIVPLPGVVDALTALRDGGVRIGILSHRGSIPAAEVEAALDRAGLLGFVDPALVVYGRKDSVRIFESAAALVPAPRALLFVGEDASERWFARQADFRVCPHPRLAPRMLLGPAAPLRYVRIRGPVGGGDRQAELRRHAVVPLHTGTGTAGPELYAVVDSATALDLDDRGFWVDRLGAEGEPDTTELFLLRDDGRADALGDAAPGGGAGALFADDRSARRVLASTSEGLYVAVPAGRSVEALHLGSPRHGHNLKLTPVPALLAAPAPVDGLAAGGPDLVTATLTAPETAIVRQGVTAARIARDVDRYSGARVHSRGVTLASRHIHHPDNARAVQGLCADLAALGGLTVRTHRFTHEGRAHDNVEAVLPGTGIAGSVLVTAHLDSTASRGPGFRPAVDPAPGADDDASGVAAVLAAARTVLALAADAAAGHREFRFVLFNAEEHGLVGSRAYARDAAARGVDIVAVLQLDMVGFDAAPGREFELHAGFSPSAAVQKRSIALAELVAALVPRVSPALPAPQLYPAATGGPDPAEQRSDHYSFQLHGYPACLASEDFFAGPGPSAPAPDGNPHYHRPSDTTVDSTYARDITRAVTAAAWICGTR